MTNTYNHAKRELEILSKTTQEAIILDFHDEILALCEKFGQSGQSGGSAPYIAGALSHTIKTLCLQQTLAPLTGEDDEWGLVAEDLYQNNRESALFKNKNGRAYYLDAIIWKTQSGSTWSGSALLEIGESAFQEISSRQFVKSFPFTPKKFYIEVMEVEVKPDDFEFYIKDPSQLDQVWEYYEEM